MEQKQKSIKKNYVMNIILSMSSFLFPLITFPYISRILLPEGVGKISLVTSVVTYFSMFAQLGIPTYGICTCAKIRDDKEKLTRTVHELLFLNLMMALVAYAALAAALALVPKIRAEKPLYLIVSLTILLNALGMEWLYKALEQYSYITIRSLVFKVVALVAMFLFVHEQRDYVIYGAITILASSASNVLNFINAHRYISMHRIGGYNIKRHIKPILVFFSMACATTIYTNLDNVMLGFMTTDTNVGYYNTAVKIKVILVSIVTSLGTVLLPRASYYVEHGMMEEFRRITRKALNFVFLLAVPMTAYFMLFARQGVYFLSGAAYEGSILPMQIIMPTLLFIGITNILGIQMLIPLGREKVVLYSEIAGAVADLLINLALIPKFAAAGAALGTVIAEFVVFLVQYAALRKEVTEIFRSIHYVRILAAVGLGAAASIWCVRLGMSAFVTLVISASLFFLVYGCVLLVRKEELVVEITGQLTEKAKSVV